MTHAIDSKTSPCLPIAVHCYQVPNPGRVHQLERLDVPLGAVALRVDVAKTESLKISTGLCHADQHLRIHWRFGEPPLIQADRGRMEGGDLIGELERKDPPDLG